LPGWGLVELVEQTLAASGQGHRLVAVVGAVDEGGADVGFQPVELQQQVAGVQVERVRGAVDAGVGGQLLESVESLPAVAFAFDGSVKVGRQVGMRPDVDGVAG
jgi:hypothetical protein